MSRPNRFSCLACMHARYLVELAAIVASQSRDLCGLAMTPDFWGGNQYWAISRARLQHWVTQLKAIHQRQYGRKNLEPSAFRKEAEPILEEIFLSEVCTRVWCATLAAIDHASLPGELDPIACNVFVANLEVRRRALRLLLFVRGLPGIGTNSLNRLRRDCETWTDQLLARISPTAIAVHFCFEKRRVREIAKHARCLGRSRRGHDHWIARLAILRYELAARPMLAPVCPELNSEVCSIILGCLPLSSFDASGMLRPSWGIDGFQSDTHTFSVLTDLCSNAVHPHSNVSRNPKDRR